MVLHDAPLFPMFYGKILVLEWRQDIMMKNKIENDQEIIDEKREKHNLEFEVERDMRYVVGYRAYRKIRRKQGFFRCKKLKEGHMSKHLSK
jgi:hypothetical protein